MNIKRCLYILFGIASLFLSLTSCSEIVAPRHISSIDDDWSFAISDTAFAYEQDFNDDNWQHVNLPHDWAAAAKFNESNPSGPAGAYLPGGNAWYRKKITISDDDLDGRILLSFDGIYMNATVFVNGVKEGRRPNGFIPVVYDITADLKPGENIISVKVENADCPNANFYTGAGINRHVWLTKTGNVYVAPFGTCVRTPLVNDTKAEVSLRTTVKNTNIFGVDADVKTIITDARGRTIAKDVSTVHVEGESYATVHQDIRVPHPILWDVDNPHLYQANTTIIVRGNEVDNYTTKFGIRSFYFDAETGFTINDHHIKLNGVCLYPDLGALGARANKYAIAHRLQLLKNMGCNAIRCMRTPPAPELLDVCDSLGILVINEAFDVWRHSKTKYDYAYFFNEWAEKDLTALIMRDRNHPSLIAWSIGDDVLEQNYVQELDDEGNPMKISTDSLNAKVHEGTTICTQLADLCHRLDPSRLVTAACSNASLSNNLFRANALDIIGINHNKQIYDSIPLLFSGKPFLITESTSSLSTRGYYRMPSVNNIVMPEAGLAVSKVPSLACSSYDNCRTPDGTSRERAIVVSRDNDFISGQFVNSGFDHLGDPTPFPWPARSSYTGILDIAGLPKDAYYLYQSEWQNKKTVLHLFPHWNWKLDEDVDLWCYFNNADEVELFVNDHSQGVRTKTKTCLHAIWTVPFEPGTCRVVSRKDGKVVAEKTIVTAGHPAKIKLSPSKKKLHADGEDLCFVTVEVTDEKGNPCPYASNEITFSVEGAADIEAVDNGCPYSLEPFHSSTCRAFNGKCVVILRSNGITGNARFIANAENLDVSEISINCLDTETY